MPWCFVQQGAKTCVCLAPLLSLHELFARAIYAICSLSLSSMHGSQDVLSVACMSCLGAHSPAPQEAGLTSSWQHLPVFPLLSPRRPLLAPLT